jgi:endonuclease G
VNQPANYLMEKPQYALSYHRDNGRANWVSWHLDSTWMGSAPRQDNFRNDTTLPAGWYQVQGTDYSGSGFDRGHYCPSADRTSTVAANSATFLMTNMMPQAPDNNQGPWADLENYARTLVNAGNELHVIMGGAGQGGTGSNGGVTMTIAGGHVQVPAQTWKVILVQPQGTDDVARVTTSTRVIAVIMPNTQGIRTNMWESYRVSVDEVEQLTGYDFFSNVPSSIQASIESVIDNQ